MLSTDNLMSVSDVNKYIKQKFIDDALLSNVSILGEISNYSSHSSGHIYFTLKDERSSIKCVMFKSYASKLKFLLKSGMKVIICGSISVFERDGQYQIYVENILEQGMGSLHIKFEQLKEKLEKKGYFKASSKKSIPFLPKKIAVVTSPTGSVIKDILNVLSRRFENFNVLIFPVSVQGENSANEIAGAIDKVNKYKSADVIIIARGGGSLEDLWSFNEEILADSIFKSEIPIISGVGHETDFTICDFVSDLRAPTPSVAAEMVLPKKEDLINRINYIKGSLSNAFIKCIRIKRLQLERFQKSRIFREPTDLTIDKHQELDMLNKDLKYVFNKKYKDMLRCYEVAINKLDSLSPLKVLGRGYVSISRENRSIKSIDEFDVHDIINLCFVDGYARASVISKDRGFK